MIHPSHEHELILNEDYIARDSDMCRGCGEKILSCKSFVYSCSRVTGASTSTNTSVDIKSCVGFLLHKNCAELPPVIQNPSNLKEINLCFDYLHHARLRFLYIVNCTMDCDICKIQIPWFPAQFFYHGDQYSSFICPICVLYPSQPSLEDPKHDQHLLSLIQHPSSFRCYACNVNDNIIDMSYRCTSCQFWIHKSCADAPMSFQFQFHHKHPLSLSFSLPPIYHKFGQYCRLYSKSLSIFVWNYYCRFCRFFVHFRCARISGRILSSGENEIYDNHVVQLPAADGLPVQLLCEKFIKAVTIPTNLSNIKSIFNWVNDDIEHRTHEGHHLQLISRNELETHQIDNNILLCDGCVQPIRTDPFYGCVVCKYILHKFCAELPTRIGHHYTSGPAVTARMHCEPYKLFRCYGCLEYCNGIFFDGIFFDGEDSNFHIRCMTLPEKIKHESHRHQLSQKLIRHIYKACKACGRNRNAKHSCKECDYHICGSCIMKASVVKHPWDPHSLHLIYEPGMVSDHEHDYNCEFCSKDIDSNFWFYHCSTCDLSFHLKCFERSSYRHYSSVKFGATDIIIGKLHQHSLSFVLNKKFRRCEKCHENQLGEPVLECAAACKSIFCLSCVDGWPGHGRTRTAHRAAPGCVQLQ